MATIKVTKEKCQKCLWWQDDECDMWDEIALPVEGETCNNFDDREELVEASKEWLRPQLDKSYANYGEVKMMELTHFDGYAMLDAIEFGANWQKQKLWKDAQGDDLPEIDREVVALQEYFQGAFKVVFAHRPNPKGWDGKSLSTGKIEHFTPKTYDKGGWNMPDVKYWLDVELPEGIE